MSENTYSASSVTEEEIKERIDVGIAFLVLLFMGALGAYLMSDSEEPFFGAVSTDSGAASLSATPSHSESGAYLNSSYDGLSRAEQQAQARASREARNASVPPVATVAPSAALAVPAVNEKTLERVTAPLPEVIAEEFEQEVEQAVEPVALPEPSAITEPSAIAKPAVVSEPLAEAIFEPVVEAEPEPAVEVEEMVMEATRAVVTEEEALVLQQATSNVSFLTGSATLTEASRTILDDLAELLRSRPNTRLSVIGYTDSQGDPDENVALSFARAEACRDYLLARGASVGQVDSAGMGQRKPIGDNSTAEGRRKNRRVEFTLLR